MTRLFVNVDHVATLREARKIDFPDPVAIALEAERAGAHGITMHLREDRRHVNDDDVRRFHGLAATPFNFELSVAEDVVSLCEELEPAQATIVPERREEVTTEGGLDLARSFERVAEVTRRLQDRGIAVSLFIDPDPKSIEAALESGAGHVELHTGKWAEARSAEQKRVALASLVDGAKRAHNGGLIVNAGHGLNLANTAEVAAIEHMNDLNIGHALIGHAIRVGIAAAVGDFLEIIAGSKNR